MVRYIYTYVYFDLLSKELKGFVIIKTEFVSMPNEIWISYRDSDTISIAKLTSTAQWDFINLNRQAK